MRRGIRGGCSDCLTGFGIGGLFARCNRTVRIRRSSSTWSLCRPGHPSGALLSGDLGI